MHKKRPSYQKVIVHSLENFSIEFLKHIQRFIYADLFAFVITAQYPISVGIFRCSIDLTTGKH